MNSSHTLWYDHPAKSWDEALPLGNGRIGAMVFGGIEQETLSLNEDTLWSGYPNHQSNPKALDVYKKAQTLVREQRYYEADELISRDFTKRFTELYMPLGDILLHFDHADYTDYRRVLDLSNAVHCVEYTAFGIQYRRTTCISHPDQTIAMQLTASNPGKISFSAEFASKLRVDVQSANNDTLSIRGICPSTKIRPVENYDDPILIYPESDAEKGISFACLLKIVIDGGSIRTENGMICVTDANTATLYFTVRTSFNGWNRHPFLDGKPFAEPCAADMERVSARGFAAILADHIADHRALYDRTELTIDGSGEESGLPTDARLIRHENGAYDPSLYALLFHFGRYLTIAASRPGTQATNLQGIWNPHLSPPWRSNYTININTEMNYWPTLSTNLQECYAPLLQLIEELAASGRRTAAEYYGARGFCSHHNTDIWRLSTPVGAGSAHCAMWAYWPMSSGWMMRHICEYYEYAQDEAWLSDVGYPLVRDCALFFADVLTESTDGYLDFTPATSPENQFYDISGRQCAVDETTTMTTAIIRDVFSMFLRFSAQLDRDGGLAETVRADLTRLRPYQLHSDGSLMEWHQDHPEFEPTHRHISHLFGLHPARQITPEDTPALAAAARKTLANRGDNGTGWSLGWKVNFWARLHDGDHALRLIDMQLRMVNATETNYTNGGGSYPNLFDAHPPFQIDGNFGVCAGIAEMLVQGDAENPKILPALPSAWPNGSVRGLRLRGGKSIDITWRDGKATDVNLY